MTDYAYSSGLPAKRGLYDPAAERDSCGVGFVADIKGRASHQIVDEADTILRRMAHRGACGCEVNTGDGAGMLTALPHDFFRRIAREEMGVDLPERGRYAVGVFFMPKKADEQQRCRRILEKYAADERLTVLGWREVPTDAKTADIGPMAAASEPDVTQLFLAAPDDVDQKKFDRLLYLTRKQAYHEIRRLGREETWEQLDRYYCCSLNSGVIVYKGQLTPEQVMPYFPDLQNPDYHTHLAMVHSRFSTNTFPSWDRAQPMRFMSHNGEINTVQGNRNWTHAREGLMESDLFNGEFKKLAPIIDPETSDSGVFDNVLELLLMAGRSLPEAVMMMIPEAWENHETMSPEKRAFYEFHSCLMEPWDGPASVSFTDGKYIGACLDRNGLRPSRYYVTHDDKVIMASEVGVLDIPAEQVKIKGRLEPGRMFLVDFDQGRIIPDDEIKKEIAGQRPYGEWLQRQRIELSELNHDQPPESFDEDTLLERLQAFGYTWEHVSMLMLPMVQKSMEALGSMGNDAALAALSDKPRLIYDYFKQRFAQVTNPPIDPIREEIIMSLECYVGPEGNLLETAEPDCHRLELPHPILTNEQMAAIKHMDHRGWKTKVIDITYERGDLNQPLPTTGENGRVHKIDGSGQLLTDALDRICAEAEQAIADGYAMVILSDRNVSPSRVPIPSLVAIGAVHHHLVAREKRTQIGVLLESGEAREVHHFCTLFGYGADGVNPYLAFEALFQMQREGYLDGDFDEEKIVHNYIKAVGKGLLKVMSKMGISTLASYKGAQIFEAIGLKDQIIDRCFLGTASRVQGVDWDVLATECIRRHEIGFPRREAFRSHSLPNPGEYYWRSGGERHTVNPIAVARLQQAARRNDGQAYWDFAEQVEDKSRELCTLRGLLRFNTLDKPIDLDEVEPAKEIVKRFRSGAMSFGALSKEAHETLAIAMNRIGGQSNSGEGGEDPARFTADPNGDYRRSAIKQIASGRFGVTSYYLANADTLQIKMAQGAKPGEGGQLPGHKVDEAIAKVRHSTPGVGLISPPPHHDIYSIEDLAQLIYDLKNANPNAVVSVKLVSEFGVGTVAAGVAKAHSDHILISGHDGGTGASPLTSIKHAGLPWELGIAETHQTLVMNDLRSRVRLETDGGLKTGRDVVIAALLGAEEYGFATMPLITMGCIMMRKCHLNTCPVGVCTQDPTLREKFKGVPEHVVNYLFMVAEHARQIMASLGVRTVDELIGRVDLLHAEKAIQHWKADGLDLTPILTPAEKPREDVGVRKLMEQDHGLDEALDNELIAQAAPALTAREPVRIEMPIRNTNRTVGTMLSHRISLTYGEAALPDDTIHMKFTGSAGQSLAAWLAGGCTIELEGDANDYVGKGLSGGKLIVYPPANATFKPENEILIGNVALYGATSGHAFFRGRAAERFCVRNSGAVAVVEGIGDHGCEYMTGGRAVILGPTGRNFAAGMSGGIAYVWDRNNEFGLNCNLGTVELEDVTADEDIAELRKAIELHHKYTGSTVAADILDNWEAVLPQFVKVMPIDYKRVLAERQQHDEEEESPIHLEASHG